MSLQQFADEYVQEEAGAFLVRRDLLGAYTQWRQEQEQQPTMQLSDLWGAERDAATVLPEDCFHERLVVAMGTARGKVTDAWKGWALTWPNGNVTQPELMAEPAELGTEVDGPAVLWAFHFRGAYDAAVFRTFLAQRVPEAPANAGALEAKVQAAVAGLEGPLKDWAIPWSMDTVQHEGHQYNVFLGAVGAAGAAGGAGPDDGGGDLR